MSRYYSDSDNAYYASRQQQSNNIRASGWQSPLPSINETGSSSVSRIVVECPFGSKKCDYTIDKSQPGRLIVTARRRQTFPSNNPNNIAVQTFAIPYDADVDRLQSYIEKNTNRLIIEVPRSRTPYISNNKNTYVRSPDMLTSSSRGNASRFVRENRQYTKKNIDNNKKVEYRIDCRDYRADELDVFIEGRDVTVQGKTKQAKSSDPRRQQQYIAKQFTRKIALPNTVDLSKVESYFENGELRIEAPLKREVYDNGEIHPRKVASSAAISNRTDGRYERVKSSIPENHRRHYRRRERVSRLQPSGAIQRARSAEVLRYPLYKPPRDLDDDDDNDDNDSEENGYRRTVNYERRYTINQNDIEQQPIYRSAYSPTNIVRTKTTYRDDPVDNDIYYKY